MKLMSAFSVLALGLSGYAIWTALALVPAFNEGARGENVFGRPQLSNSKDMYDHGSYYFQLGHGFLTADLLVSAETESSDEIASVEVSLDRADQAIFYLEKGLRYDPGNAHAWGALAWAYAMTGVGEPSWDALNTSWDLAPNNITLAERRLHLVAVLLEEGLFEERSLSPDESAHIASDLLVLELQEPRGFEDFQLVAPDLIAMFTD